MLHLPVDREMTIGRKMTIDREMTGGREITVDRETTGGRGVYPRRGRCAGVRVLRVARTLNGRMPCRNPSMT
jgi:hypothetical protein